jgi:CelD/BcsL family acetyltransferase involved in cellulose biosynthesis
VRRGRGGPLGVRHLRFISTGEAEIEETCPDYLNALYLPGEEAIFVDSLWHEVGLMSWDHLEFLDLPEDTPLLRTQSVPHNARRFLRGRCPIADLAGGFEAYLERLSSNSRQNARRLLREGERAGAQLEVIGIDQVVGAFDDLVRLHQERWTADGKPGVFATARFIEFHRNLVWQWLPVGRAVLARLSLASEPVAVLYGFVTGQTFDFYQSGVRLETTGPLRSPGNLAHLQLMRALTDRGVTAYDFLRGSSSYKERLATRENQLIGVQIWRPTLRTAVYHSVRIAGRIIRKGLRVVRRRTR